VHLNFFLLQVKGEKEVLVHFLDHAQTALRVMSMKLDQQNDTTRELYQEKHPLIVLYCSSVLVHVRRDEMRRLEMMQKQIDFSKPTIV
jgi:hypothetical protein